MGITTGALYHPNRSLLIHSEMRITTVGNLLLMAPNDKQLSKLITIAKSLKQVPAKGSLMTLDIDVTGYLRFLMNTMAMFPGNKQPLPRMGRAEFVADLENGQARAACSMMTNDIKTLVTYFKSLPTSFPSTGVAQKGLKETKRQNEVEEDASAEAKVDIVQYWLEQGRLYSTYGNHPKAIKCFKKVIALSPQDSKPHFNLGISYGELGKYEDAISYLDKALELCPENGLYLYGRGRTYLLSGDKNKAIEDFKHAAVLGNREAQDYLKNIAHVEWQEN
jgi:tetratricopeptide (TPR) repeat protein